MVMAIQINVNLLYGNWIHMKYLFISFSLTQSPWYIPFLQAISFEWIFSRRRHTKKYPHLIASICILSEPRCAETQQLFIWFNQKHHKMIVHYIVTSLFMLWLYCFHFCSYALCVTHICRMVVRIIRYVLGFFSILTIRLPIRILL